MNSAEKINKVMQELNSSEELGKQYELKRQEAKDSGQYKSDGEVVVAALNAMGYDVTMGDFERTAASAEKLDPEELKTVAGGWCWKNDKCAQLYNTNYEDPKGHNNLCLTLWHCYVTTLHTDTGEEYGDNACWKDYQCMLSYMDHYGQPIS